jgi:hypothetical protein
MAKTYIQNDQTVNEAALPISRKAARTETKDILAAFDTNFNTPFRLYASNPSSAVLNIESNEITLSDGTGKSVPPIKNQIPTVAASTINFQTGSTTGATFVDLTFPTTTVGNFRRLGLSLLQNGNIKAIWSPQSGTFGGLANPGTVLSRGAIPIGWIDLEATAVTAFKTAGSATNIIENSVGGVPRIHVFGSGGGGGGADLNVDTFTGTTITATNDTIQSWRYTGTSAQTFTAFTITELPDGGRITIIGTSDTNTITIPPNATGIVYQNGTKILGLGESVTYEKVASLNGLVEVK